MKKRNLSFCWRSEREQQASRLLELLLFSSFKSVKMWSCVLLLRCSTLETQQFKVSHPPPETLEDLPDHRGVLWVQNFLTVSCLMNTNVVVPVSVPLPCTYRRFRSAERGSDQVLNMNFKSSIGSYSIWSVIHHSHVGHKRLGRTTAAASQLLQDFLSVSSPLFPDFFSSGLF